MKAKDYYDLVVNENQDQPIEWRFIDALRKMVLEVGEISKMRNAKSDASLIAIFKEVENKSYSFIKMVNENKSLNADFKKDSLKLYVKHTHPSLYQSIWE